MTQKQLFVCFLKQLKEPFLGYKPVLNFVFLVSAHERTPKNIR